MASLRHAPSAAQLSALLSRLSHSPTASGAAAASPAAAAANAANSNSNGALSEPAGSTPPEVLLLCLVERQGGLGWQAAPAAKAALCGAAARALAALPRDRRAVELDRVRLQQPPAAAALTAALAALVSAQDGAATATGAMEAVMEVATPAGATGAEANAPVAVFAAALPAAEQAVPASRAAGVPEAVEAYANDGAAEAGATAERSAQPGCDAVEVAAVSLDAVTVGAVLAQLRSGATLPQDALIAAVDRGLQNAGQNGAAGAVALPAALELASLAAALQRGGNLPAELAAPLQEVLDRLGALSAGGSGGLAAAGVAPAAAARALAALLPLAAARQQPQRPQRQQTKASQAPAGAVTGKQGASKSGAPQHSKTGKGGKAPSIVTAAPGAPAALLAPLALVQALLERSTGGLRHCSAGELAGIAAALPAAGAGPPPGWAAAYLDAAQVRLLCFILCCIPY